MRQPTQLTTYETLIDTANRLGFYVPKNSISIFNTILKCQLKEEIVGRYVDISDGNQTTHYLVESCRPLIERTVTDYCIKEGFI